MMHQTSQRQRIVVGLSGGVDSALTAWLLKRQGHEVVGMTSNTLWVVQGHAHPWLQSLQLTAGQASWVAGVAPQGGAYAAKTRYRQADAACVLSGVQAIHGGGQVNVPGDEASNRQKTAENLQNATLVTPM